MVHLKTLTGLQHVPGPPNHSDQGRQISILGSASDRCSTALWFHHGGNLHPPVLPRLYFAPEMRGIKLSTSLLRRQDPVTISY